MATYGRNVAGARGYVHAREALERRRDVERLAGRTCTLEVPIGAYTLTLEVEVLESRSAYGREDVLVRPTHGTGEAWVSADRVHVRSIQAKG